MGNRRPGPQTCLEAWVWSCLLTMRLSILLKTFWQVDKKEGAFLLLLGSRVKSLCYTAILYQRGIFLFYFLFPTLLIHSSIFYGKTVLGRISWRPLPKCKRSVEFFWIMHRSNHMQGQPFVGFYLVPSIRILSLRCTVIQYTNIYTQPCHKVLCDKLT